MAGRSSERRPSMLRTPRAGRDLVSEALRQLWANAESDPVPDDFLTLLDRLDAARAEAQGSGAKPAATTTGEDEPAA